MWFQVPTPQTTSRSTSSRRSILKRDESLPIAPRDWVSFDATARRSTVPPDTSSRWLVALVHRQCTRSPRFCRLTFAAGRTGQPGRIPRAGRRENRSRSHSRCHARTRLVVYTCSKSRKHARTYTHTTKATPSAQRAPTCACWARGPGSSAARMQEK